MKWPSTRLTSIQPTAECQFCLAGLVHPHGLHCFALPCQDTENLLQWFTNSLGRFTWHSTRHCHLVQRLQSRDGIALVRSFCLLALAALARSSAGALLRTVARKVLHLIIFQYVDDFFGPDQASNVQHAMDTFARHACSRSLANCLAGLFDQG